MHNPYGSLVILMMRACTALSTDLNLRALASVVGLTNMKRARENEHLSLQILEQQSNDSFTDEVSMWALEDITSIQCLRKLNEFLL